MIIPPPPFSPVCVFCCCTSGCLSVSRCLSSCSAMGLIKACFGKNKQDAASSVVDRKWTRCGGRGEFTVIEDGGMFQLTHLHL